MRTAMAWAMIGLIAAGCGKKGDADSKPEPAASTRPKPPAELNTAVDAMLKLAEAKDYKTLYAVHLPPAMTDAWTAEDVDRIARAMTDDEARCAESLAAFQAVQAAKPAMSEDGSTAVFRVTVKGKPAKHRFLKIDGHWYYEP